MNKETADTIRYFATAILHGDEEHRAWLLEAAEKFIAGEEIPEVRHVKNVYVAPEGLDT